MFRRQKGRCIFFLFITHELITLSACLGSADSKTFAKASDLKTNGHFGLDHVYTKRDGKLNRRFGRLVLGRAALNYQDKVNLDAAGIERPLNEKLSAYYEEGVENSRSVPNATLQYSQQISAPQNWSRTLKNSAVKTESPERNLARERIPDHSKNVSAEGWSSQTNGCALGEIDSRHSDNIKTSGSMKHLPGYQSDSAPPGREEGTLSLGEVTHISPGPGPGPGPGSVVNEGQLRMKVLVHCGSKNMSLMVRKSESAHLMIDQGQAPPLSLSQLPLCGYSVKTTWRDLVFTALYDGCHVQQEDGRYVLSLIWWGNPVKMSCPIPVAPTPLSLCCNPFGMTVTVGGSWSAADIEVDMGYEWRSLSSVAEHCGYIVDMNPGKQVISVPFNTCGVSFKDGKYALSLRSGEKESTFSCSAPPSAPSPASPPFPSIYSHSQLNPILLTPLPTPSASTTGTLAIPEHTPKFPMFSWHQPHYPTFPPGQNAYDPHPVDSTHLHHRVPVLYPQRPPNPLTHPEDPPLPEYSPSTSTTTQISVIPVLHTHKPPNLRTSTGARNIIPDDCETSDSTSARLPPLHLAIGQSPPAAPPVPLSVSYYNSQLHPHNSHNPNNHFNTHLPPVIPAVRLSPPHPLPRSNPYIHLNQQQLTSSMDSFHQLHGLIQSPPQSLPHLPDPHPTPSFNHPKCPDPVHPRSIPSSKQPQYPDPVDPRSNPSSNHPKYPDPVDPRSNPSSNHPKYPHPVHPHSNPSTNHPKYPDPVDPRSNPSSNHPKYPDPVHPHSNPSSNHPKYPDPVHPHSNPSSNHPKYPHPVHPHSNPSTNHPKYPDPVDPRSNPSSNHPKYPDPVHPHSNPSSNHPKYPDPVHPHSNPSNHPKYPDPVHPPGNPSFNTPKYPHPVPTCPAVSYLKTSVSPVPLAPPPASSPFLPLPSLSCEPKKMTVILPSVLPASIAFKDPRVGDWIPIGSADPDCSFMLYMGELGVLTLSSPIPACYSCSLSPAIISLHMRYWDMVLEQFQILDLKCLYSAASSQSPTAEHHSAPKPQVYCMADHMSVRLPSGVWDVFVQDMKGNEIRLLDAPEDCGYAVRKHDSHGTILTLPFTCCQLTNQGQKCTIGIKILSERGSQVEWLSCPIATPISKQDCSFPGDTRQLCGLVGHGSYPESGPCYLPTNDHFDIGYMADGSVGQSEASPSIQANGPMGVQLGIGTDHNYTSYYQKNSRKFRNLLGRPLFLELRLVNRPDPSLGLLVHYCLAYSTSAQTPWLLIYHRTVKWIISRNMTLWPPPFLSKPEWYSVYHCALIVEAPVLFLLESCLYPQRPPVPVPPSPVRKITITTFEHPPPGVQFSPDEEISFWCSTAVCSQSQMPCMEGCFT